MKINVRKDFFIFSLLILLAACGGNNQLPVTERAPEQINKAQELQISSSDKDAAEPNIATAADGSFYLTWVEHGKNKQADVYLQHFSGDASALGEPVRINPQSGQATAWFGDAPTLKVGKDNTIYVGWTANFEGAADNSSNLLLSVSNDGGKSFALPVKVNDDFAPASHGMHSLAIDENNRVYMAWLDERNLKKVAQTKTFDDSSKTPASNGFQIVRVHHNSNQNQKSEAVETESKVEPNSEIFYAVSKDGGKTFSSNKKLSVEVCPCCKTSITAAPDGKVYVAWRQVLPGDFRHVAVASSVDGGENFSKPVIVSDDQWQINACPVSGAALAVDKNNILKIIWFTAGKAGSPGLYEAESKDDGKTFSARAPIFTAVISGTPILSANEAESIRAVWESNGKLYESASQGNQITNKFLMEGKLPAAVFVGSKLHIAYIGKKGENRTIYLTEF